MMMKYHDNSACILQVCLLPMCVSAVKPPIYRLPTSPCRVDTAPHLGNDLMRWLSRSIIWSKNRGDKKVQTNQFDIIQKSSQGGLPSAYSVVDVGTVIMRQRTESLQCRFMALWEPASEHTQSKIKNQWFRLEIWWNPPQFHDEVMMKSYEIVMFAITADPIWPPPRCSWALDFRPWKLGSHKRCVVPAFDGTQVLCTLFLGRKPYWDEDFIVPKVVPWMVKLTGQEPFSLDKRHNICNVYRYYNVI